ncbi:unnamed protein product [Strongylus vulgaris]|uniref:Uncharacterized protein n=1 Tax=Strongylus vulgaris TaxID=40348 RepID=A0A3P7LEP5_STRVU|nr:unnamed protein product [Strongylus vulgaris]
METMLEPESEDRPSKYLSSTFGTLINHRRVQREAPVLDRKPMLYFATSAAAAISHTSEGTDLCFSLPYEPFAASNLQKKLKKLVFLELQHVGLLVEEFKMRWSET